LEVVKFTNVLSFHLGGHGAAGGLGKSKNFINPIGTGTRDPPACSTAPQPYTLLRKAVIITIILIIIYFKGEVFLSVSL
jgi:hypothetical protein